MQTQVIGTPGYMPPEQNSGKPLYSSDIYALGKTAIYGLTGRTPTDWDEIETNEMISWYDKTTISQELARIIQRMTSPKTAERYQSAREVIEDLTPLLKVGTTIGDCYLILAYLGGEKRISNYLVKHTKQPGSPLFFLKILRPKITKELDLAETKLEIEREINRLDRVSNKQQTLKILKCFIDRDLICLLQEYIEGYSVAQLLARKTVLSEEDVINLLIDTLLALAYCHKNKIIHGNIQPSSLLKRRSNGKIVLQDFSDIDRFANDFFNTNLGYIPPEQIAGRTVYASDVYALGMTAIHCLTGVIPQKLNISHQTGEILWEQNTSINPGLIKIINKMVRLERKKRYTSANQVLKAVRKLKRKTQNKSWYLYLIILPILFGVALFALAQWAQRAAILEFYNGDLKLERKQYDKAIRYYEEGLRKLPKTRRQVQNFEQVWLQKSRAYNQLQQYEDALATCQEALRYYQSYQLWNCQGLALNNLKRYEAAITAYDNAIALNPDYIWSWNNRGDTYTKLGKTNKAIADFQKAVELNPEQSFVPWNNLGKLYFQLKDYPAAIEAYQNALSSKDDYLPALVGLGNSYKSVRKYTAAMEVYEQAIDINPKSHESWYGKALVAESLKDYAEARLAYKKAIALKQNWQAALDGLARVEDK